MNKAQVQTAIQQTQDMLARFWQKDLSLFLKFADEHIVWIGSQKEQFCIGREATRVDLEGVLAEMVPCHLSQEEFYVAQNLGKSLTLAGRYYVTTDEGTGMTLQVQQRCVCTWEEGDDGLRVSLLCVSNPLGELQVAEDERFVGSLGRTSYNYLMSNVQEIENRTRHCLVDTNNITHFFSTSDILYVEADGKRTIFHTRDCDFSVNRGLGTIEELTGTELIRIHRAYLVNPIYIRDIQPYELNLVDGTNLTIPEKRYREVHDLLVEMFHK